MFIADFYNNNQKLEQFSDLQIVIVYKMEFYLAMRSNETKETATNTT